MVIKCSGLQWDINCNAMQNVWTGILWEQYLKTGIHWVWNIIRCRTAGITICNLVDSHFTYSTITIRPSDQLSVKNAKGHARSNTKKLLNSKKSRQLTELSSLTTNGSDESSTALPHFVVKDDGQLNSKREERPQEYPHPHWYWGTTYCMWPIHKAEAFGIMFSQKC